MAGKSSKYKTIFKLVVSRYITELQNQWPGVENRYTKLSEEHNHVNYNPRVVKPSGSDFIADVELSAKEVLTPSQYIYFKGWYLQKDQDIMQKYFNKMNKTDYLDFNLHIQETVGAQFKADKIHPTEDYFKPRSI